MDIGGHLPIPLGAPPLSISVFQFRHSLLFLAVFRVLNFWSHFGGLIIQVDTGGHPPITFEPPSPVLSIFPFRHNLLFLAFFRVPNFLSRFEALNDVFWENGEQHGSIDLFFSFKICSPRIDLSNEVWYASNEDCMPKLRPWEVETPIYPNGAHSFGASSPRVRVLAV